MSKYTKQIYGGTTTPYFWDCNCGTHEHHAYIRSSHLEECENCGAVRNSGTPDSQVDEVLKYHKDGIDEYHSILAPGRTKEELFDIGAIMQMAELAPTYDEFLIQINQHPTFKY